MPNGDYRKIDIISMDNIKIEKCQLAHIWGLSIRSYTLLLYQFRFDKLVALENENRTLTTAYTFSTGLQCCWLSASVSIDYSIIFIYFLFRNILILVGPGGLSYDGCPEREVFSDCANCKKTCNMIKIDEDCICYPGCECKPGYLRNSESICVLETDCGNVHFSQYLIT